MNKPASVKDSNLQISNIYEEVTDLKKYIKGSYDALNEIKERISATYGRTEAMIQKTNQ